ncbi:hypothetical protein Lal_00037336, partial [Lupinus albus]
MDMIYGKQRISIISLIQRLVSTQKTSKLKMDGIIVYNVYDKGSVMTLVGDSLLKLLLKISGCEPLIEIACDEFLILEEKRLNLLSLDIYLYVSMV